MPLLKGVTTPVVVARTTGAWSTTQSQQSSTATYAQNVTFPTPEKNASQPLMAI
jgi:hypothetical protein